jgi:hypothetical protein
MNISVTVEVDVWDRMRNSRRQSPPVTWFLRLFGVGYLVWGTLAGPSITLILLGLLAGLAPESRGIVMHLSSRKYGRTYTYVLSDQGVNVRTRLTNLDVAWDGITRCRETAEHWILRFPGGGLLHVPKHALTPTDRQAVREVLAHHRLIKAGHP